MPTPQMFISQCELARLAGRAPGAVAYLVEPLGACLRRYRVATPLRQAHFLAQVLHESGRLRYTEEVWGPTAQQRRYEPPGPVARRLGNTEPGDGYRFRGRGLIQLTGRANYRAYDRHVRARFPGLGSVVGDPGLVADAPLAVDVAGWYWDRHGLNALADEDDLEAITRRVNGGLRGLEDRRALLRRAGDLLEAPGADRPAGAARS